MKYVTIVINSKPKQMFSNKSTTPAAAAAKTKWWGSAGANNKKKNAGANNKKNALTFFSRCRTAWVLLSSQTQHAIQTLLSCCDCSACIGLSGLVRCSRRDWEPVPFLHPPVYNIAGWGNFKCGWVFGRPKPTGQTDMRTYKCPSLLLPVPN